MFKYSSMGVLEVSESKLSEKINSCKMKHFNKLDVNNEKIQQVCKMFKESPRYIFSQLQVVYWKYFEEDELDKFNNNVIGKIIKTKTITNQLKFNDILQELTKKLIKLCL